MPSSNSYSVELSAGEIRALIEAIEDLALEMGSDLREYVDGGPSALKTAVAKLLDVGAVQ